MRARGAAALAALLALAGCDSGQLKQPSLPPLPRVSGRVDLPAACAARPQAPDHPGEPSLAVDPGDPRELVAAWQENRAPDDVGIVVAVSHDGGTSWTRAALPSVLACTGGLYVHAGDPWVSIGRDGVVYVSALVVRPRTAAGTTRDIVVSISRDHGATWERPAVVESATMPPSFPDKETILADPRRPGYGYVVWAEYGATASSVSPVDQVVFARTNHADFPTILVARSEDAGRHWRPAQVVVRQKPEAFLPTLAVAGDATVGMLWFDVRHFVSGSSRLDTDVWFSTSSDRGAHWVHRHAAGPFDLRTAPRGNLGPFIGDYMGVVGLPDGFGAVFVQARPQSRNGPTDVFFSRITGSS